MSGIGNTVETDLVGELASIYSGYRRPELLATGVIRAITCTQHGNLVVWMEVKEPTTLYDFVMKSGDIVTMMLSAGIYGDDSTFLRLQRGSP